MNLFVFTFWRYFGFGILDVQVKKVGRNKDVGVHGFIEILFEDMAKSCYFFIFDSCLQILELQLERYQFRI